MGFQQAAPMGSRGQNWGLRVKETLKFWSLLWCCQLVYVTYQLGTSWTNPQVWKIRVYKKNRHLWLECSFFASAIMKVTENPIYISEIVSSNFLFCQTFVWHPPPHSFSFSVVPAAHMLRCKARWLSLSVSSRSPSTASLLGKGSLQPRNALKPGQPLLFPGMLTPFPHLWRGVMAALLGNPLSKLLYLKACFIVLLM